MLDILKNIMDLSNDKRNTLLYFLDDKTRKNVEKYNLVKTDELYLYDSCICINKSTLEIEFKGIIQLMEYDRIVIKLNNSSRNIDPKHYHIFVKKRMSAFDNRKFFEKLLKKL